MKQFLLFSVFVFGISLQAYNMRHDVVCSVGTSSGGDRLVIDNPFSMRPAIQLVNGRFGVSELSCMRSGQFSDMVHLVCPAVQIRIYLSKELQSGVLYLNQSGAEVESKLFCHAG